MSNILLSYLKRHHTVNVGNFSVSEASGVSGVEKKTTKNKPNFE